MLVALGQSPPAVQSATADRWISVWDILSRGRQAVGITIPQPPHAAADDSHGLFLALVPNLLDAPSMTLFGLLATPIRSLKRPPAAALRPKRGILRRAAEAAEEQNPGGLARRVVERQPVAWADGGHDDAPDGQAAAALELGLGAHYGAQWRQAAQVPMPAQRATVPAVPGDSVSKPLEALRVAVLGFAKHHEVRRPCLLARAGWDVLGLRRTAVRAPAALLPSR